MDHHQWRRSPDAKYAAVRAALFKADKLAKQPDAFHELLEGPGCEEMIGPIKGALRRIKEPAAAPPKSALRNLTEALHSVLNKRAGGTIPLIEDVERIRTDRVLSCDWAPYRTMNIFTRFGKEGTMPGPAEVSAILMGGQTYYMLNNGNHRSEAAKLMGRSHLDATIGEYSKAEPSEWIVGKGFATHSTALRRIELPVDQCAALLWLGAKRGRTG